MIVGIDLSMRSTGLYSSTGKYSLVQTSAKDLNNEELLIYNANEICNFIELTNPKQIIMEALSLGSVSGSMDILWGNFWYVRVEICKRFPTIPIALVPVLEWRAKVLDKDERNNIRLAGKEFKSLKEKFGFDLLPEDVQIQYNTLKSKDKLSKDDKKQLTSLEGMFGYKNLDRKQKQQFAIDNDQLILAGDIKYQTFLKLPTELQEEFSKYKDGKYDLTDAYFLSKFIPKEK